MKENSTFYLLVLVSASSFVKITLSRPIKNKEGISRRMFGLSFKACRIQCWLRRECLSISYSRRFNMCELYYTNTTSRRVSLINISSKTINVDVEKDPDIQGVLARSCSACSAKYDCVVRDLDDPGICELKNCGSPKYVVGASILGNSHVTESKLVYACREPFHDIYERVSCQENGTWTDTRISCTNCVVPDVEHGTVDMYWYNETTIAGNVTCDHRHVYRGPHSIGCHSMSGLWDERLSYVCCDTQNTDSWRLIFRMNADYNDFFLRGYRFGDGFYNRSYQVDCQYRNDEIIANWTSNGIQRVKLQLVKDEEIKAFLIFNGVGTDEMSWFSTENLLNSSWTDLMDKKDNGLPLHISFSGSTVNEASMRFLVSLPTITNPALCNIEFGWMFASRSTPLPCIQSQTDGRLKIIYSNNTQGTMFGPGSSFDFADKMEIYVETSERDDVVLK